MEKYHIQLNSSVSIGKASPTALNVLIGSNSEMDYPYELEKIKVLNNSDLPVSIVTDLSLGKIRAGNELWRRVVKDSRFIAGTVPVYQVVGADRTINPTQLLENIQEQAEAGVRLITIHPTPNYELIEMSKKRLVPITSRGGAAVCIDMIVAHRKDNIYIQILDQILKIAIAYGLTLSIGSSFRSANLMDSMDQVYQKELWEQIEIANYCKRHGVSPIIETPGHASPQNIFKICDKLNEYCPFPIMPLGPLPIDCAFDQDDLAASIGAVLMGTRGCADILSVVTSEEHSGGIPTLEALIAAVKKYSVAKHIIDVYKLDDMKADEQISLERSKRSSCIFGTNERCIRCGELCPLNSLHSCL